MQEYPEILTNEKNTVYLRPFAPESEIGTDSLSMISKAEVNPGKPVVFYGTSITQGGCASRTGMVPV